MYPKLSVTVVLLLLTGHGVAADDIVLESGATRTSLLELYTSEGCSSCPPADRYLSGLVDHPQLWSELVPVAFHVDYWDYIGWRDRFADPSYGTRQYAYAKTEAVRTVYTPGFFLDGYEWRGRHVGWPAPEQQEHAGVLTAVVSGGQVDVGFSGDTGTELHRPLANVALLGFGLSSEVKKGENHGRTLNHDFVILDFVQAQLKSTRESLIATVTLPDVGSDVGKTAIAVWVSYDGQPRPVQATGGWLD